MPSQPLDIEPDCAKRTDPSALSATPVRYRVLDCGVDALDRSAALNLVSQWARRHESRTVLFCNVHGLITARSDAAFAVALNRSDLVVPDGSPVAWMLRRFGVAGQRRVYGPDFFRDYCRLASARGESIYLYGGSPETLARLQSRLLEAFPGLQIAGALSPPFRPTSAEEDDETVARINASGAGTVWVGLGCPKQEIWMAGQRGRVQGVLLGVGAAFDFHAGTKRQAPAWMREGGLEWLHRLFTEPRRLWRRYLVTNSLFVILASWQLIQRRLASKADRSSH
jgi:N-acetylglucosaminyldiphosphoundecaprenol N-acetyl-beta-D-mannosaminyltransferase